MLHFSLLSRVFSFQNLKCDVPGKFQLDPLDIVLRSPKIVVNYISTKKFYPDPDPVKSMFFLHFL